MYAVLRPALRSSSRARPQARFIRGRRYPLSHRARLFHSTRFLAQRPNPPSSPDNAPADPNDADNKARAPSAAAAAEQTDTAVATEDPEILAQKLQRSKEMSRRYSSALRRSQRRNRAQDLPPIHIPDWFLNKRVRLREDSEIPSRHRDCTLSIKHVESGEHGTCSIPFPTYAAGVRGMSELVHAMWKKGMSEADIARLAHALARRPGHDSDPTLLDVLEAGQVEQVSSMPKGQNHAELEQAKQQPTEILEETNSEARSEKGSVTTERKTPERESQVEQQRGRGEKLTAQERKHDSGPEPGHVRRRDSVGGNGSRLSPLILAEIRAVIAASLSSLQPTSNDTFPASKTNLILHSPSNDHEPFLRNAVHSIASELGADIVSLNAQDLAQIAGDYLGEGPEPSPHSIRSLGYETYKFNADLANDVEEIEKADGFEDEQYASGEQAGTPEVPRIALPGYKMTVFQMFPNGKGLNNLKDVIRNLQGSQLPAFGHEENMVGSSSGQPSRGQGSSEVQIEDLKLGALLDALIDSNDLKRGRPVSPSMDAQPVASASTPPNATEDKLKFFDFSLDGSEGEGFDLSSALPPNAKPGFRLTVYPGPSLRPSQIPQKPKIIHISDIKELNATQYGSRVLLKLEDIVRKQRNAGESVMILGTTSSVDLTPELTPNGVKSLQSEGDDGFFRTIVAPIGMTEPPRPLDDDTTAIVITAKGLMIEKTLSPSENRKLRAINLRHIQDMLHNLDPQAASKIADMEMVTEQVRTFSSTFPDSYFGRVLTYDEVHRIALTALGLHTLDPSNKHLSWAHVSFAMGLLKASDEVKFALVRQKATSDARSLRDQAREQMDKIREAMGQEPLRKLREREQAAKPGQQGSIKRQRDLDRIKAGATKHEKALMQGIVNPDQIKTTFEHVHVPKETVEAIRTLTSLSLLRPDAFNYGVLATEKISGALLYGPPGTGKTLLAKAVAKESGSTVLEVSGSQIMDKYVGEGEKNVTAVFSLARKLSPCIVFLDEADAIFGSRDASRERTSHRDILNQFLKEWDGLNDLSVFVMVATNRPFDMDDAVIRRLPRRLLVDLPTQEDRKKIMEIHLRGEQLHESIDLDDLAKRTPFYSGSDLKNVAVFAALACVREENEQAAIAAVKAATQTPQADSQENPKGSSSVETQHNLKSSPVLVYGQKYEFPERRVLHLRHFDKALQEVSASISEDMSSLNAIKKFDEQYGDRKGRRKKAPFGLGVSAPLENAVRVRT